MIQLAFVEVKVLQDAEISFIHFSLLSSMLNSKYFIVVSRYINLHTNSRGDEMELYFGK